MWDGKRSPTNSSKRVIEHDLRIGERGRRRDPILLRETFKLACRYTGQAPSIRKLAEEIQAVHAGNAGVQRIAHYLELLHQSLLVILADPLEIQLKRMRAPKKIFLTDHALRAAILLEKVPLVGVVEDARLVERAGRIVEGMVGAYLASMPGLGLAWRPERPTKPEIDFVATIGDQLIPIEVKFQRRIDPVPDTAALRSFVAELGERSPFGLLVTRADEAAVDDPRIVVLPLPSLLLLRGLRVQKKGPTARVGPP